MAPGGGGNIKVVVRVRPFNSREKDRNAQCIVNMKENQTTLTPPSDAANKGVKGANEKKTFAFDHSYWSFDKNAPNYAGQENLFQDLGVPLLDNAFAGYNNCIFAYGQTGSGKSYSMMGYGEEHGVIPKICQNMFDRIEDSIAKDPNVQCTVEVSYLEIYNEKVRDLLNPSNKGNLKVREHPSTGPYVEDLSKLAVRSFKEIENLMDEGNKARTVAATNMNETSSRSHSVFTLTLAQKRHDTETKMSGERVAKISLVDLAGSERATSTGATGARLKEGAEINKSLSSLGRVIAALADLSSGKSKKANMVPYRDSVLTWLLKDSLGGNSMTAMIAAISPADINFEETLSTLRYADSAKRIKNHAVVNEDPNARMIRELKEELALLRSKLSGNGGTGGAPQEQYDPNTPLDQQFVSIMQADGTTKRVSKADIAEQLSQSEKLYTDLNQTWEEKLAKTEQIQKEREAALEELGISIEKGFVGLSTPKKMPHLVNLSDDPMLAGCLVYNLKPGRMIVGNADIAATNVEIRIAGSKILPEHCTFENTEGVVTVTPNEGAAVMINGIRIEKQERLRNGNRLILGDFHIFRFNNPQEPKERAEPGGRSLLRHSVTASQLSSPSGRQSHDRSQSIFSGFDSDISRSESPAPSATGVDSDWSFARREAAVAILGLDQKINHLTDEELDSLFEDVQRARHMRRGRPESRTQRDDEHDSDSSIPSRDKYLSGATLDNFSLDTALTVPGTPQIDGADGGSAAGSDGVARMHGDLQAKFDKQKEEYQSQLREAEASNKDLDALKEEKLRMEEDLQKIKSEMQAQLIQQKQDFEQQIRQMLVTAPAEMGKKNYELWSLEDKARANVVVERWRQLKNIAMTEVMLRKAVLLKEAQVLATIMKKPVNLQFMVVEQGQDVCSSYDQVLNDFTNDDDESLLTTVKPFVAVRVMDSEHAVIHLWSLEKLEKRVQSMRQMYQYHDRPDYMQHFQLQNPFTESFMPQYTLVGNAHIPLTAVLEYRVQDYTVHVDSPYTHQAIGIIRLSLEPSSAQAPPGMIKFNVIMHDMVGFAEREGGEVHAQLYIPGVSQGATTTQIISEFDEGPVKFETVHNMSLHQDSPKRASLVVAVFAKISSMHLDMISSWDEMREASEQPVKPRRRPDVRPRINESQYITEEQHDVFATARIMELSETGGYETVEVEQESVLDNGTFQLHQGLQRRIVLNIVHTSTDPLRWQGIASLRVGNLRLIDPNGKEDSSAAKAPDVPLKFVHTPEIREEASGTTYIKVIGQWDSSIHDTSLLDRPTADRYIVRFTLSCDATCQRADSLLTFSMQHQLVIKPRAWIRPQALFKSLLGSAHRVVHATASIFTITLTPAPSKRAEDLWRLSSRNQYIKGEENLGQWSPRGVSLIKDYMAASRKRQRLIEVDAAKASLAKNPPMSPSEQSDDFLDPDDETEREMTDEQRTLLSRMVGLWQKKTIDFNLAPLNTLTTPPTSPGTTTPNSSVNGSAGEPKLRLFPAVLSVPKNPTLTKSGPLLAPATMPFSGSWIRRQAELRPPYLHLHAVGDGEEVAIINLRNATVDAEPEVGRLLDSSNRDGSSRVSGDNVFAVYTPGNSWMFAARSQQAKSEWIFAVDSAFAGGDMGLAGAHD